MKEKFFKHWTGIFLSLVLWVCAYLYVDGIEQCSNICRFLSAALSVLSIFGSLVKMTEESRKRIREFPKVIRLCLMTSDILWLGFLAWNGWFIIASLWTASVILNIGKIRLAFQE